MKVTIHAVRRPVHVAKDGPACGAPRGDLLAIGPDNDDRPELVTCPACKRIAARKCGAWVIESI